mmetsp:Transcript_14281/g.49640  ORF Transcript_14281/g.49640 Transcript_14281/m.49640 type:complete len:209 (-) Transcript_14281:539-1165(-)
MLADAVVLEREAANRQEAPLLRVTAGLEVAYRRRRRHRQRQRRRSARRRHRRLARRPLAATALRTRRAAHRFALLHVLQRRRRRQPPAARRRRHTSASGSGDRGKRGGSSLRRLWRAPDVRSELNTAVCAVFILAARAAVVLLLFNLVRGVRIQCRQALCHVRGQLQGSAVAAGVTTDGDRQIRCAAWSRRWTLTAHKRADARVGARV